MLNEVKHLCPIVQKMKPTEILRSAQDDRKFNYLNIL